ncbi:hypothetical protein RRG08_037512 [Elysia crispata]|uniref:Uncharacterized protein n=1 Tax=Elysia crispata TaxID=231223 RepID=A0AAE1DRY3_9GAST|nr:hypothetical protein RRG08_037512 [Elysia crispata]
MALLPNTKPLYGQCRTLGPSCWDTRLAIESCDKSDQSKYLWTPRGMLELIKLLRGVNAYVGIATRLAIESCDKSDQSKYLWTPRGMLGL